MCNFISVLILRNGDVLHYWALDSHSSLIRKFGLNDADHLSRFAKAELVPGDNWLNPETWSWKIDEDTRPAWLDEVEETARKKVVTIAKRTIFTEKELFELHDGCYILGGTAKATGVGGGCRVMRVQDSAQISGVRGSARISGVRDSAQISDVGDSAQISGVWDSAQISGVGGSAVLDDSAKAHFVKPN